RETMYVDRMVALDICEQVQVPLERYIRIVAALHQDLHGAQLLGFLDLLSDLLIRERPPFVVLRAAIERAEAAIGNAHIRVIDIPVYDISDRVVRMLIRTDAIGLGGQLEQRR